MVTKQEAASIDFAFEGLDEKVARHKNRVIHNLSVDGRQRRKSPSGERVENVSSLRENGCIVAQRVAMGDKNKDIARDLGLSPAHVSDLRNSPIVKAETAVHMAKIEDVRFRVQERIAEHAEDAVQVVAEVMNNRINKSETRLRAALGILDRNGNGPTQQHIVTPRGGHLSGDALEDIRRNGAPYLEELKRQGVIVQILEKDCEVIADKSGGDAESTNAHNGNRKSLLDDLGMDRAKEDDDE